MSDETKTAEAAEEKKLLDQIEKNVTATVEKNVTASIDDKLNAAVEKEVARQAKSFAVAKDEAEAKGSLGEYVQALTKFSLSSTTHQEREAAHNLLENKYKFSEANKIGKAMTQGSSTEGAHFVPTIFGNELFSVRGFDSVFFPDKAYVFPMASNIEKRASWDYSVSVSGGQSAYGSGWTIAAVNEATAPTAVTPTTKQITFTCDGYKALTEVSNELALNNNIGLEMELTANMRNETISQIDYAVFNGNGGNLTGFIGATPTKKVPRNSSSDVKLVDLAKMYARRIPSLASSYVWVVHPQVLEKLLTIETGNGNLVFVQNGNDPFVGRIWGVPVYMSDNCPALGQEGDVCLVARNAIGIGINKAINIAVSEHYGFGKDVLTYRTTCYVAVKPMLTNKIKCKDNSYEVAGYITLDDSTT